MSSVVVAKKSRDACVARIYQRQVSFLFVCDVSGQMPFFSLIISEARCAIQITTGSRRSSIPFNYEHVAISCAASSSFRSSFLILSCQILFAWTQTAAMCFLDITVTIKMGGKQERGAA